MFAHMNECDFKCVPCSTKIVPTSIRFLILSNQNMSLCEIVFTQKYIILNLKGTVIVLPIN